RSSPVASPGRGRSTRGGGHCGVGCGGRRGSTWRGSRNVRAPLEPSSGLVLVSVGGRPDVTHRGRTAAGPGASRQAPGPCRRRCPLRLLRPGPFLAELHRLLLRHVRAVRTALRHRDPPALSASTSSACGVVAIRSTFTAWLRSLGLSTLAPEITSTPWTILGEQDNAVSVDAPRPQLRLIALERIEGISSCSGAYGAP